MFAAKYQTSYTFDQADKRSYIAKFVWPPAYTVMLVKAVVLSSLRACFASVTTGKESLRNIVSMN